MTGQTSSLLGGIPQLEMMHLRADFNNNYTAVTSEILIQNCTSKCFWRVRVVLYGPLVVKKITMFCRYNILLSIHCTSCVKASFFSISKTSYLRGEIYLKEQGYNNFQSETHSAFKCSQLLLLMPNLIIFRLK